MKKVFFLALAISCFAACSKDHSDQPGTVTINSVSIKSSGFSPSSILVNINNTVTWTNDDNTIHTVTADDGSFDSGDIAPGAKYMHTFSNTGTVNYHCTYHTSMTGIVTVTGIR